ncbi:MAG: peptide methionine sulfoxide reductase msrA/msrB [Arenicella sp.]|jgi:peptide methionine sulfoxide reductase msrA/msrB
MKLNDLNDLEKHVIVDKGTEPPFVGEYDNFFDGGQYQCKQCDAALYRSEHKFHSHCGWPSFDNEIDGAVRRILDADGSRVEIVCAQCDGHLGHVFEGERLTENNIRHCVNSISMKFVSSDDLNKLDPKPEDTKTEFKTAYYAGGCFWGVEHLFQQVGGVNAVISGYMGGHKDDPSYQDVCGKASGHVEVVSVKYDASAVSFTELTKLFFEIHDPTQENGQGPDIGPQYASAIFYNNESEQTDAQALINELSGLGYNVVTQLRPLCEFWSAEEYHQDYYARNGQEPYCHAYTKRFV